jgi:predicted dehydrogenase
VSAPVQIGVVGLGYWGPNLARNFDALPDAELAWLCDGSEERLEHQARRFPSARATTSFEELLADPELDAVALATPVPAHAEQARQVLGAGKHCFVEKPLAQSTADAESVVEAARPAGRTLMVGHLLEYHPGLEALKELMDRDELGKVHYIYGNRLNLGKLRPEENALWSLGAHDVSVVLRLAGEEPVECAAHLHLSWLDPHKERRFTVVGSKKMATFDDMALEQKLTVYDKGFDQSYKNYGEYIARSGDIYSPQVSNEEPLRIECRHFVDRVLDGGPPRSDGEAGVRVVRVLEELQRSLDGSAARG